MISLKLGAWKDGDYAKKVFLSDSDTNTLLIELIERLKADKRLPADTFMVTGELQIVFHVGGNAEKMKGSEVFMRTYVISKEMVEADRKGLLDETIGKVREETAKKTEDFIQQILNPEQK